MIDADVINGQPKARCVIGLETLISRFGKFKMAFAGIDSSTCCIEKTSKGQRNCSYVPSSYIIHVNPTCRIKKDRGLTKEGNAGLEDGKDYKPLDDGVPLKKFVWRQCIRKNEGGQDVNAMDARVRKVRPVVIQKSWQPAQREGHTLAENITHKSEEGH